MQKEKEYSFSFRIMDSWLESMHGKGSWTRYTMYSSSLYTVVFQDLKLGLQYT